MKVAGLLVVVLALCGIYSAVSQSFPAVYNITVEGISPEGIEYDPQNNRLVIGSTTGGFVRTITPSGNISVLVNDARVSVGTFGLDYFNGSLYIAVTNTSALASRGGRYTPGNVQSALAVADATTGVVNRFIDLTPFGNASNMWANDLAVTSPGVVHLTDAAGRQVWRVEVATGSVRTIRDPLFAVNGSSSGVNLNGIKPVRDYVITCATDSGLFFKISQNQTVSIVNNLRIQGCDGIRTTGKSPATLVVSTRARIYELASNDDFESAYILQSQNTTYGSVSTSALIQSGIAQQTVYSLNRPSTAPYPIERTLAINNAVSFTPSPSSSPSASPSPCGCASPSPSPCSSNNGGDVIINFYFADILNGL